MTERSFRWATLPPPFQLEYHLKNVPGFQTWEERSFLQQWSWSSMSKARWGNEVMIRRWRVDKEQKLNESFKFQFYTQFYIKLTESGDGGGSRPFVQVKIVFDKIFRFREKFSFGHPSFSPGWQKLASFRQAQKMPSILSSDAYLLIRDKKRRFSRIC